MIMRDVFSETALLWMQGDDVCFLAPEIANWPETLTCCSSRRMEELLSGFIFLQQVLYQAGRSNIIITILCCRRMI